MKPYEGSVCGDWRDCPKNLICFLTYIDGCRHGFVNKSEKKSVTTCVIDGCGKQTSNVCEICTDCHPMKPDENFCCFIDYSVQQFPWLTNGYMSKINHILLGHEDDEKLSKSVTCRVVNCEKKTFNSCAICTGCHPFIPSGKFACKIGFSEVIEEEEEEGEIDLFSPEKKPDLDPFEGTTCVNWTSRPPRLHRELCTENLCRVKGCDVYTSNSCTICTGCHPTKKTDKFPCYIDFEIPRAKGKTLREVPDCDSSVIKPHRQEEMILECRVTGCKEKTANYCMICTNCHPVKFEYHFGCMPDFEEMI